MSKLLRNLRHLRTCLGYGVTGLALSEIKQRAHERAEERMIDLYLDLNANDFEAFQRDRIAMLRLWWRAHLRAFREAASFFFASAACGFSDHVWEDDGCHAGPDSATDSYSCARCGFSFDHTYY